MLGLRGSMISLLDVRFSLGLGFGGIWNPSLFYSVSMISYPVLSCPQCPVDYVYCEILNELQLSSLHPSKRFGQHRPKKR